MFPSTDSAKNAVDMFPRTDILKWHSFYPLEPCWVRDIDDKCKKQISAWKTAWIQGFQVICHLPKMCFLAAEMPGNPVFLCVWLFVETHPQPFGAASGGRGCVDGKDEVWNGLMCFAGINTSI